MVGMVYEILNEILKICKKKGSDLVLARNTDPTNTVVAHFNLMIVYFFLFRMEILRCKLTRLTSIPEPDCIRVLWQGEHCKEHQGPGVAH